MGKTIHNKGYIRICKNNTDKLEHRQIMEKKLGRKLTSGELVHHEDENKQNNSPKNLKLTNRADHTKHHHKLVTEKDMVCDCCGGKYKMPLSQYKYKKKKGQKVYVCSKKCVGRLSKPPERLVNPNYGRLIKKGIKMGLTGYAISKKYGLNKKTVYNHIKNLDDPVM